METHTGSFWGFDVRSSYLGSNCIVMKPSAQPHCIGGEQEVVHREEGFPLSRAPQVSGWHSDAGEG